MRIAYISSDFGIPIPGRKGASVHVAELIKALTLDNHEVLLISPVAQQADDFAKVSEPSDLDLEMKTEVFSVPQRPAHLEIFQDLQEIDVFLQRGTRIRQELRNILYNRTLLPKALQILRDRPIDLIYERYTLFSYVGIRLARMLKVPHLLEVNAPLAEEQERTRGLELGAMAQESERRIFSETDHVLTVSNCLKQFINDCGIPNARISVVPNAFDPTHFSPDGSQNGSSVRARLNLVNQVVIGFVGSLKSWHGVHILLEAYAKVRARLSNTHLLIVGDGPEASNLMETVKRDRIEDVTFVGDVAYDEIPDHIDAMDITVAPYGPMDRFYYSPIKLFEYMGMGKPVVASRIGQLEELIIAGETGVLIEPGEANQLASALISLAQDAPLRQRLGHGARAWSLRERTWAKNAKTVLEIAERLSAESVRLGRFSTERDPDITQHRSSQ